MICNGHTLLIVYRDQYWPHWYWYENKLITKCCIFRILVLSISNTRAALLPIRMWHEVNKRCPSITVSPGKFGHPDRSLNRVQPVSSNLFIKSPDLAGYQALTKNFGNGFGEKHARLPRHLCCFIPIHKRTFTGRVIPSAFARWLIMTAA